MIFEKHRSHLTHLVRLCILTITLQIDFFFNTGSTKDVMATADTPRKTKTVEQGTKIIETNTSVGSAAQHAPQSPFCTHASIVL